MKKKEKPLARRSGRPRIKRDTPIDPTSDYQPTKAELEADVSIKATPDELLLAVFGRHPHRKDE